MQRVVAIVENLGPYHIARFRQLAAWCDLGVVEINARSAVYLWNRAERVPFRRATLSGVSNEAHVSPERLTTALRNVLSASAPDVLFIPGWSKWYSLSAACWAHENDAAIVVMSESQQEDSRRYYLTEWLKRCFLSQCSSAFVGGTRHQAYLENLGFSRAHITVGYDVVDNVHFKEKAQQARAKQCQLRQEYALPDRYFLTVARFEEKKNLSRLLRAYSQYVDRIRNVPNFDRVIWHLVILGDGRLRTQLEGEVEELGLRDSVHLPGFIQYQDLPIYYGLAETFVLPSTVEPWGLVVNEAMASALPVLVSRACGCSVDLIREGLNGYTFDPEDTDRIAELMCLVHSDAPSRRALGRMSSEIVERWGVERFAEGFMEALRVASSCARRKSSLLGRLLVCAMARFRWGAM